MKRVKIVIAFVAILCGLALAYGYAYMEPQTWIGGIFLKSKYNPKDTDLEMVSNYLSETNGGSLPNSFDRFLFRRLGELEPETAEFRNIIGFYASQAISSRAGRQLFEDGDRFLPSIIRYGREANPEDKQLGYLFLAYGIIMKQQAYKPSLFFKSSQTIDDCFTDVARRDLSRVRIESP